MLDGEKRQCGKCPKCKAKKRRDWSFRLGVELKHCYSSYFITLTYSDLTLPTINGVGTLNKRHCQLFLKRLRNNQRKLIAETYKCTLGRAAEIIKENENFQIKYYLAAEYGDKTQRPHYHVLLFNLQTRLESKIHDIWKLGSVDIGEVTPESINYTTKYMLKKQFGKKDWRQKPFTLQSKNPAIGKQYLETHGEWHKKTESTTVRNINGNFQSMPKYYRDRIWTNSLDRKRIIQENMDEFIEKKEKEIKRLSDLGQLTPRLELSKVGDILRRAQKETVTNNTF